LLSDQKSFHVPSIPTWDRGVDIQRIEVMRADVARPGMENTSPRKHRRIAAALPR
jgi:hypothetical protein